jgi:3-hydroxy acid dehydrogenase / malonic semialdehyde reductase
VTLKDKRILLTGGTTGIGRAMLTQFAAARARVLTLARDQDKLDQAIKEAGKGGVELHGIAVDLAKRDDIARVFAEVDAKLGGLDILVSNAALGADPIDEMADDDWRYVVDVNLVGALACARGALERLGPGGQIVIIGSISSEIHAPGESVYSATKAGLAAFAETLRKEVAARNIRVSLVQPGTVSSDMQEGSDEEQAEQLRREEMLPAGDIADAVSFILTRPPRVDIVTLRIEPRMQKLP